MEKDGRITIRGSYVTTSHASATNAHPRAGRCNSELMARAPVLPHEIVRQHAEMAAFLWTVYD